jgi:hypothetical protein
MEQVLMRADKQLGLAERLSAAWKVSQGARTRLSEALLMDARRHSELLRPAEVTALRWSSGSLALLVGLLVLLLVLFLPLGWLSRGPDPLVTLQGELVQELGRELARRVPAEGPDSDLIEELERLGRRLQDGQLSLQESDQLVDELLRRVEERIDDLIRQLPGSADGDAASDLAMEPQGALRIERRPAPPGGSEQGVWLDPDELTPELAEQLRQALQEDSLPDLQTDGQRLFVPEEVLEDLGLGEESERISSLQDVEQALESLRGETPAGQSGEGEAVGEGERPVPGGEGDEEGTPGEGWSAGREPGSEAESDRFADTLERASSPDRPVVELTGPDDEDRERTKLLVRAMPSTGQVQLPIEDRLRLYERQAEEAIRKETVPEGMRDIVAEYFISIGLSLEEAGKGE